MTGIARGNFAALADSSTFINTVHSAIGWSNRSAFYARREKHSHLKCTSFDLPAVEPVARKVIAKEGLSELAKLLGLAGQRPDKEWREGPDNLWCLRAGEYLLIECKSEDKLTRSEINKREAEQMNRSSAWFAKYYTSAKVKRVMIIPTDRLSSAAGFIDEVEIMRQQELQALTGNVRRFFSEFRSVDFKDLSEKKVQQLIDAHKLSVDAILTEYTKPVRSGKE
jgi:hypothetical protein